MKENRKGNNNAKLEKVQGSSKEKWINVIYSWNITQQ